LADYVVKCHICGEKTEFEDVDMPDFCSTCAADLSDYQQETVILKKVSAFDAYGEKDSGYLYLTNKRLLCVALPDPQKGAVIIGGIAGGFLGGYIGHLLDGYWNINHMSGIGGAAGGALGSVLGYKTGSVIDGWLRENKRKKVHFVLPLAEIASLEEGRLESRLGIKVKAFIVTTTNGGKIAIAAKPMQKWIEAIIEAKEELIMQF